MVIQAIIQETKKIQDFLIMSFLYPLGASKSTWGIYYPKNWFMKFYIYMIGHAKVFRFETAV